MSSQEITPKYEIEVDQTGYYPSWIYEKAQAGDPKGTIKLTTPDGKTFRLGRKVLGLFTVGAINLSPTRSFQAAESLYYKARSKKSNINRIELGKEINRALEDLSWNKSK
jgi:hypothetical protein